MRSGCIRPQGCRTPPPTSMFSSVSMRHGRERLVASRGCVAREGVAAPDARTLGASTAARTGAGCTSAPPHVGRRPPSGPVKKQRFCVGGSTSQLKYGTAHGSTTSREICQPELTPRAYSTKIAGPGVEVPEVVAGPEPDLPTTGPAVTDAGVEVPAHRRKALDAVRAPAWNPRHGGTDAEPRWFQPCWNPRSGQRGDDSSGWIVACSSRRAVRGCRASTRGMRRPRP